MQLQFLKRVQPALRIALALAIAMVAALPAAPTYVFAAVDTATGANLSLEITPAASPILAGQTATFRVELKNVSGAPLPNLEMRLPISGPVDGVRARIETETGAPQSNLVVRNAGVVWRGGLQADGIIAILIAVKSDALTNGGQIAIDGEAGPRNGAADVTESASVTVNPLGEVNRGQLSLTKSVITPTGQTDVTENTTLEIGPRNQMGIELQLKNNSDQTVYSLLVDEFKPSHGELAAAGAEMGVESCQVRFQSPRVIEGRGMPVAPEALAKAGFGGSDTFSYGFLVATPPDGTTTVRVRAQTAGQVGCQFENEAAAYVTNLPPAENGEFNAETALALLPQFKGFPKLGAFILFLIIVSNDLGDAPDSTNHDGVPMDAYAGVPNANFPTVFDPATGAEQGPIHRNPNPLHLGPGVDWELEADRFAGRNLIPTANTNNLDALDDGLDVASLNFTHCMPPQLIDYEITANQTAVNLLASQGGVAYVNMWLDGNHDGDWKDTLNCDGITAYEHIVVDQQVFITAPGTLNLVLTTGNIPIPQNGQDRAMWLRLTISDEPSVKVPAGGAVGDGRGPAGGFRLGETEDYLYKRNQASPPPPGQGPDAWLDLENFIEVEALAPSGAVAAASATAGNGRYLNSVMKLRNSGNFPTGNVRLVVETTPYLGQPTTSDAKCCQCLTCTVASALTVPLTVEDLQRTAAAAATDARVPFEEICEGGKCRLEADLGYMEPGGSGRIFARFALPDDVAEDVQVEARIITEGDVNPSNNLQNLLARLPIRTPTITRPGDVTVGWTGCLTCTVAAGGGELLEVEVAGFGEPGSTLRIFSQNGETEVTADADGFWQGLLALPDGSHQLVAEYLKIPDIDGESVKEVDASTPKLVEIVAQLPWNPATFGFTKIESPGGDLLRISENDDSCGPWGFQDVNGRTDPNNWRIPVWRGATHEIGIDLNCSTGSAQLQWGENTLDLIDGDGDGRYTASFEAPVFDGEPNVTLVVTCDGVESAYSGFLIAVEPAQVVNAATGAPLSGAQVTLWQRNLDGAGAKIAPWQAQAYGQTNPQSTSSQGEFSFIVPPGGYGLTAQIDGFQPFQGGPFTLQGAFPSRTIALTPNAPAGPAAQVSMTADGFDPPALQIPAGSTVEWSNTGLLPGSSVAAAASVAAAGAASIAWDSGQLAPGASYRLRFDQPGAYTYVNAEDPNQEATIIVTEPVEMNTRVFMPIVTK